MPSYKKLVRDNIPEIIQKTGGKPVTRILSEKEYLIELINKLKEEVAEFEEDHSVEELADIQEVIYALRDATCIHSSELEKTRQKKATKNGRFKKRIYLEDVK